MCGLKGEKKRGKTVHWRGGLVLLVFFFFFRSVPAHPGARPIMTGVVAGGAMIRVPSC